MVCVQVDIVPREEIKQEGEGMSIPAVPGPGSVPPQAQAPGMPIRGPNGQVFYPNPYAGGVPGMPMDPKTMGQVPPGGAMPNMQMFPQQQFMQGMQGVYERAHVWGDCKEDGTPRRRRMKRLMVWNRSPLPLSPAPLPPIFMDDPLSPIRLAFCSARPGAATDSYAPSCTVQATTLVGQALRK